MNTNSNTYTFVYASVLVIVFAALLSLAAIFLQPYQNRNIEIEKKQNILASVNISSTPKDAEQLYSKYIVDSYIVNTKGEKLQGDAFNIDLKKELDKDAEKRNLPVFVSKLDNGNKSIVVPVRGKGLWGPIWGYVSFEADYNTIKGAIFDHKGETPGLGAEISTDWFQKPFKGRKIFADDGSFTSVQVLKSGQKGDPVHSVDAISGGTITSKGLEAMLQDCLKNYEKYFKSSH